MIKIIAQGNHDSISHKSCYNIGELYIGNQYMNIKYYKKSAQIDHLRCLENAMVNKIY